MTKIYVTVMLACLGAAALCVCEGQALLAPAPLLLASYVALTWWKDGA